MGLREDLRCRVQDTSPQISQEIQARTAVLVWDKKDPEADCLCSKTASLFPYLFQTYPLEGKDPATSLQSFLASLAQRRREGSLLCREGVYLLWVWAEEEFCPHPCTVPPGLPVYWDLCRLASGPDVTTPAGSCNWLVDTSLPEAASALGALLAAGQTGSSLVSSWQSGPFWVQATLHNSVERDLAGQLRDRISAIIDDASADKTQFQKDFGPSKQDLYTILHQLPHLQDLPIFDAESLAERLSIRNDTLLSMFARLLGRGSDHTVSAADILDALFGKIQGQPCYWWLLTQVEQVLPELCRSVLRQSITDARLRRQPLGLLSEDPVGLALSFREQAAEQELSARRQLESQLAVALFPRSAQPGYLLELVHSALECWDTCVRDCVCKTWWGVTSTILREQDHLLKEARDKKQQLLQSLTILNSMDLPPQQTVVPPAVSWQEATPSSLLGGLYSRSDFTEANLGVLIKQILHRADRMIRAVGFDEIVLLWDSSPACLELLNHAYDRTTPIFVEDQNGFWVAQTNRVSLRLLPVPGLGPKFLWEIHIWG